MLPGFFYGEKGEVRQRQYLTHPSILPFGSAPFGLKVRYFDVYISVNLRLSTESCAGFSRNLHSKRAL